MVALKEPTPLLSVAPLAGKVADASLLLKSISLPGAVLP